MEKRPAIEVTPSGETYLGHPFNLPKNRSRALSLVWGGTILLCLLLLLAAIVGVAVARQTRMELTAVANQTHSVAETLTALPTPTYTLTATRTRTPTVTPSPTITLTPTATPVMAWSNGSSPDGNGRSGFMLSMTIGQADDIYIAYFEDVNDDLRLAKLVNGGWRTDRLTDPVNIKNQKSGWYPSIVLGQTANPYVSYYDRTAGSLRYIHQFSPGNWSSVDTLAANVNVLDNVIQLDDEDIVYAVFIDKNQGGLFFTKNSAGSPKPEKIDSTGSLDEFASSSHLVSFVITQSSKPSIVYLTGQGLKFAQKVGNTWKTSLISPNGLYPDLAADSQGGLHLVYYDSNQSAITYGYLQDGSSSWLFSTVDNSGNVGLYPSLFIDALNVVHIIYYDATNISLKYAVGNRLSWNQYTIATLNSESVYSDLVVDSKGVIHVIYFDGSVEKLRYLKGSFRK